MRSSKGLCAAAFVAVIACSSRAHPQVPARGFAVERFHSSSPGAGWFVMDSLDMHGGLGGTMGVTGGYAHHPLHVGGVNVVSHEAIAEFGFAATYDRFRFSLAFATPAVLEGDDGTVAGHTYSAPSVDPGNRPDSLGDMRLGFDARLFGRHDGPLRMGLAAQLFVPNGSRADYVSDETYRAMGRWLFAGDVGLFTYAAHVGVHVRPLDEKDVPGSPRGSELLFGVAGGPKLRLCDHCNKVLIIGPEIYGATAFRAFLGHDTTALEGLLSTRLESTADDGAQLRIKLGVGTGIHRQFGAPDARIVISIELFDRNAAK